MEEISRVSARVCIAETARYDGSHDPNARWDLFVTDNLQKSKVITGSESLGTVNFVASNQATKACKTVTYPTARDSIPAVIVTATHRGAAPGSNQSPVVAWVQESTAQGFTACVFTGTVSQTQVNLGFDYFAFPANAEVQGNLYKTGTSDVNAWAKSPNWPHWCQRITFANPFTDGTPVVFPTLKGSASPIVHWIEEVRPNGFDVCVASVNNNMPNPPTSTIQVDWVAVASAPELKGRPRVTCEGVNTEGIQELDLDNDPTTPPVRRYCRGNHMLVNLFYNTDGDDYPNTIEAVEAGWTQTRNGFTAGDPGLILPYQATSAALGLKDIQANFDKRGYNSVRMCFLDGNKNERICRLMYRKPGDNPGKSFMGVKTALEKYLPQDGSDTNTKFFMWTVARLYGLPYTNDPCFLATTSNSGNCQQGHGVVSRAPGNYHDFGTYGEPYGMAEHGGYYLHDGPWHGWGWGESFRPSMNNAWEMGNSAGTQPGFSLWIGQYVPQSCSGLPDGVQRLNMDRDPTTEPTQFFCRSGTALMQSFYNTNEDDYPNDLAYLVSGFSKVSSGNWEKGDPEYIAPNDRSTKMFSLETILNLKRAGFRQVRMCFVDVNQNERACRWMTRGGDPNPGAGATIRRYNDPTNQFAWVFARMAGLPNSGDKCYGIKISTPLDASGQSTGLCQGGSGMVWRDAGEGGSFGTHWDGVNGEGEWDFNHQGYPRWQAWRGVWHGWGHGASFKPAEDNIDELSTGYEVNPNGNYGFQLWVA